MVRSVNGRWIWACGCVLTLAFQAGCDSGTSADEASFMDNEEAVAEFRKDMEITEQVRAEELQQDEQTQTTIKARDIGPLNELVRHRESARSRDGSSPAVDIGPNEELERHRQSGGCLKCPR